MVSSLYMMKNLLLVTLVAIMAIHVSGAGYKIVREVTDTTHDGVAYKRQVLSVQLDKDDEQLYGLASATALGYDLQATGYGETYPDPTAYPGRQNDYSTQTSIADVTFSTPPSPTDLPLGSYLAVVETFGDMIAMNQCTRNGLGWTSGITDWGSQPEGETGFSFNPEQCPNSGKANADGRVVFAVYESTGLLEQFTIRMSIYHPDYTDKVRNVIFDVDFTTGDEHCTNKVYEGDQFNSASVALTEDDSGYTACMAALGGGGGACADEVVNRYNSDQTEADAACVDKYQVSGFAFEGSIQYTADDHLATTPDGGCCAPPAPSGGGGSGGSDVPCDDYLDNVGCRLGQTENRGSTYNTVNDDTAAVCCSGTPTDSLCGDALVNDFGDDMGAAHAACASAHGSGSSFYDSGSYTGGSTDLQPDGCCVEPSGGGACADEVVNRYNSDQTEADAACVDKYQVSGFAFEGSIQYTADDHLATTPDGGCCAPPAPSGGGGSGGSDVPCDDYLDNVGCRLGQTENRGSTYNTVNDDTAAVCCSGTPTDSLCGDALVNDFGDDMGAAHAACASAHGSGSSFYDSGSYTGGSTDLQPDGCCVDPSGGGGPPGGGGGPISANPMCDTHDCSSGRLSSQRADAASIECTSGTCSERLCCTSGNEQKDKRYRAALEREDKIRDRGSQSALDDIITNLQALAGARNGVSAGATKQDRQQAVDTTKLGALSGVPRKILQRFLVAQLAGDLDADKGDVDLVVPKSNFARANRDAALDSKGISNLLMRAVKTKLSDADCGGADIHIDEVGADEFVEVVLLEEDDFSLKCHNGNPVSKVVLTSIADDDSDDSYEAFCRESVGGWVSQGTFAPDSSFICSEALPGHVHWIASDGTGGADPGATCDAYQCPSGYTLKASPETITGEDTPTCCDQVPAGATCDAYACPYGYTLKENPDQITGEDTATCCDDVASVGGGGGSAPVVCQGLDLSGDGRVGSADMDFILAKYDVACSDI